MKVILLIVALLCLVGTASATDYYVSTTGDNSSNGLTTGTAWQNVSYGVTQLTAGDTLYLIDGTWYGEVCEFANSGTEGNLITVTAYNGTPTMIGTDKSNSNHVGFNIATKDYININNLTISTYYHTITALGSYINIEDCDLGDTGGVVLFASRYGTTRTKIDNCTIHDTSWNTIQILGNREPPNGNGVPSTYITITNNTIYNNSYHNTIDFFGNTENVLIQDNLLYNNTVGQGIFSHDDPDYQNQITIHNNTIHDHYLGIQMDRFHNSTITNNTIYDIANDGIYNILTSCTNITYQYNNISDITGTTFRVAGQGIYIYDNNMNGANTRIDSSATVATVRNSIENPFLVQSRYNSTITVEDITHKAMKREKTFDSGWYSYTAPVWTTEKGYFNMSGENLLIRTTIYDISLTPDSNQLQNVTVNTYNLNTDVYNITINSSVAENPTWINFTVANASNTYNVSIDGIYDSNETSSSDSVVSYRYSEVGNEWDTPHSIEVTWFSTEGWQADPDANYLGIPTTFYQNGSSAWLTIQPSAETTVVDGWSVVIQ